MRKLIGYAPYRRGNSPPAGSRRTFYMQSVSMGVEWVFNILSVFSYCR
jgi:hypothetical protein